MKLTTSAGSAKTLMKKTWPAIKEIVYFWDQKPAEER